MPTPIAYGWQVENVNGTPVSGARIYFFAPGTTTPRTTYTDSGLSVPAAHPVEADAAGWFNVYLSSDLGYDVIVKSADDSITYQTRTVAAANSILAQPNNVAETFAAARLMTPTAGTAIEILGRSAAGDYGGGLYRAAVSAAADNDGTILTCANGVRLIFIGEKCTPEQWGATTGTSGSCTAAYNTWATEAVAGRAPRWLNFPQRAVYRFVTAPNAVTDGGQFEITGTGIGTSIYKGFTSSSESEGVFKFVGACNVNIRGFASRSSDNTEGGSIIRLEANAGASGGHSFISDMYMTFENSTQKALSAATAANPAVFTSAAHGYSNGDRVVLTVFSTDANWLFWNYREWTISDATTDTFTLTEFGSATKLNTTGYGAISSGTVTRCRAPHAHISIDGSAKTTGATGIRGVTITDSQIFGAGQGGAVHATSVIGLYMSNVSTSGAGLNGAIVVDGTVAVPSYYVAVAGGQLDGFREDRSILTMVAAINQGSHLRSANTSDSAAFGKVSGFSGQLGTRNSARDYIPLSGGRALQRKKITGVTGSYATFTWPFAFKATPDAVWVQPLSAASTAGNAITNAPTSTGVDVAGANLSAGGDVEIFAIGEMA
jgi:hypothetical protein